MKRIIQICYILILITCIFSSSVSAVSSDIFSMTGASGSKDDEVTVYISLDKEIEFAAADLVLEYDASKLEFVKYEELDVIQKAAMNIVNNNSDTGKIAIGYVSNPSSATKAKAPGKMLSIVFKIKVDSNEKIRLNLKCTTLKKDSGEDIQVSDAQAEISVTKKSSGSNNNTTNTAGNTTKENKTENVTTSNTTKENKTENVTTSNTAKENKTNNKNPSNNNDQATGVLPNAGKNSITFFVFLSLIIVCVYSYKKYKFIELN